MGKNVNEATPKKLLGYALIAVALILFVFVIVSGVLLAAGVIHPIMAYTSYPNGEFAGIVLQLGIYAILAGVGFGIAEIGVDLVKD
jgi:polyferredoxin